MAFGLFSAHMNQQKILYYNKSGAGESIIVLLHGFLSSSSYWTHVQETLSKNHTVISIDLLGFGKSPKPRSADYTTDEQCQWIARTLLQVIGNKKSILIGHSMGALIASKYTSLYPKKITKLILVAPPIFLNKNQAHQEIYQTNIFYKLALYTQFGRIVWPIIRTSLRILPNNSKSRTRHAIAHGLKYSTHYSRSRSLQNIVEGEPLPHLIKQLPIRPTILVPLKDRTIYNKNIQTAKLEKNAMVHYFEQANHHFIIKRADILSRYL